MKILYSSLFTALLVSSFCATAQQTHDSKLLRASAPVVLAGQHNRVLENLNIHDVSEPAITLTDCADIVIRRCTIRNGQKAAILLTRCTNVSIEDNDIIGFTGGVTCLGSTGGIVVAHNYFQNMRAVGQTQGHFVRFEGVRGRGNRIELNYGVNVTGESTPEVAISVVGGSGGTATEPLLVRQNYLNGGGPSNSGGGIAIGESSSDFITAEGNVIINPGQYGLGITGGTNNQLLNNVVYSAPQPSSNVGTYAWGGPYPVRDAQVVGNRVNFRNRSGVSNGFWSAGVVNMTQRDNAWADTTITAAYPAPTGAGVRPLSTPLAAEGKGIFYKALNLAGDSLTLDGHYWTGATDITHLCNGATTALPTNQLLYPLPDVTDATRANMLRTFVSGSGLQMQLRFLPIGQYNVYLYVSTWTPPSGARTLQVQNQPVSFVLPDTLAGSWRRVGPYPATVDANGQLLLTFGGAAVSVSGVELWRTESNAVLATRPVHTTRVEAYPNPFQTSLALQLDLSVAEQMNAEVLNTLGICVYRATLGFKKGVSTQLLSLSNLPSGRYVLRFTSGSLQATHIALVKE